MIYEKSGTGTVRRAVTNTTGMCVKTAEPKIVTYDRENIMPIVAKKIKKSTLKRTMRRNGTKRKKQGGFFKLVTVTAAALFCLFTFDAKKLDGQLFEKTKEVFFAFIEEAFTAHPQEKIQKITEKTENIPDTSDFNVWDTVKKEENPAVITPLQEKASEKVPYTPVSGQENMPISVDGDIYYPIVTKDLSAQSVAVLSNGTSYSPDMEKAISTKPVALENLVINENEPLVLIVHTHACESYTEYSDVYPQHEATRSEDTDKNVVRVGKEIADTLKSYGINTIHCTQLCDKESFINAYNVSHNTVREYLEKYPSIRVVIDVHRDAIVKENGESIRPAVTIAGQEYAQLMFVVGTDKSGHSHPDWQNNLSFAATVQSAAEERYPSLFRSINLRSVPFNQWLSDGYLLLEAGSVSNTLDEALLSAQAFAHTLTAVLKENAV